VSGLTAPIAGRDGRAYGVLGAHTAKRRKFNDYDVAFLASVANVVAGAIQRRQLDQRHELMIRELRHRSGNLFSQLLALFSQTAKNSRGVFSTRCLLHSSIVSRSADPTSSSSLIRPSD
jgi:GAF domain-containing protein